MQPRVMMILPFLVLGACSSRSTNSPRTAYPPSPPPVQVAPRPGAPTAIAAAWTPWGIIPQNWTFPDNFQAQWPTFPWPLPPLPGMTSPTPAPTQSAPSAPTWTFPQISWPFPPIPNPSPAPPTPPSTPESSWPTESAMMEQQVLDEVNAWRAAGAVCGGRSFGPAVALVMNSALRSAARGHSLDMGNRQYFDHVTPEGRTMSTRVRDAGFQGNTYLGENIAAGNSTASATVKQWMNSPGHCINIMTPEFRQIGVGHAAVQQSPYVHYWTQNFAGQ